MNLTNTEIMLIKEKEYLQTQQDMQKLGIKIQNPGDMEESKEILKKVLYLLLKKLWK